MHASIAKKLAKKMKRQAGFTLLEILVVLTIMGFLIAMVAPRLAGISGDAVDTVCDSNQNRMVSMMSGYFEKTNRYPDKLTNLVDEIDDGVYQIPAISDDDPDNGPETIASEFNDRNHFRIHYLDAKEAAELKNMGIVSVFNLNAYDAYNEDDDIKTNYDETIGGPNEIALGTLNSRSSAMEKKDVTDNLAVMMIGFGAPTATAVNATVDATILATERGWGEGDFLGRIVLGFGPENSLVTSGIVSNAAHCPGGIQNADNVTYNDYNIVLPRLEATVDRFDAAIGGIDAVTGTSGTQVVAVGYDEDTAPGSDAAYNYVANDDNLKIRTYDLIAQEKWQYATMCPEGHKFPADDGDYWGLDFDPTAGDDFPTAGTLAVMP